MIRALRRRMILTVLAGLLLASAGVVFCINALNQRDIRTQVEQVLSLLIENGGERPLGRGGRPSDGSFSQTATRPPLPDDMEALSASGQQPNGMQPMGPGYGNEPTERRDGLMSQRLDEVSRAGMSNYYTIWLDKNGTVQDWVSDRADLYTDDEIADMAAQVFVKDSASGNIGSQYFKRSDGEDSVLIVVVDARVEQQNARSVLRTTALAALIEDILLSIGAILIVNRLIRPVDQAFEKQKQFVWDASHELKTPLAVISANAQVLEGEIGKSEELAYIRSEIDRSDALIQNLLALARMDKDPGRQPMERFDMSRAVLSVALPFESVAFEAGRTLETDVPEGISAFGNEEMVKQLVVILLSNAVKYSDDAGTIRVSLAEKGERRILRVYNTGDAIPEEAQQKIFDRFYRVDQSHNSEKPGSGLGLAIAKSIVEIHKGRIDVTSAPEQGTTFTVTLPGRGGRS
ncbi:MAG: HAMP domain-containing histidine kinase [Clostridiales bacterium]|nr:HAMP domain-containing histidine kinase [Clostridiales bacterium]